MYLPQIHQRHMQDFSGPVTTNIYLCIALTQQIVPHQVWCWHSSLNLTSWPAKKSHTQHFPCLGQFAASEPDWKNHSSHAVQGQENARHADIIPILVSRLENRRGPFLTILYVVLCDFGICLAGRVRPRSVSKIRNLHVLGWKVQYFSCRREIWSSIFSLR